MERQLLTSIHLGARSFFFHFIHLEHLTCSIKHCIDMMATPYYNVIILT